MFYILNSSCILILKAFDFFGYIWRIVVNIEGAIPYTYERILGIYDST